ncbi:MAG: peptidylprolyl isomerase [Chitinophagales bacterium]|nr:peptidylprolyl isomerase [Chitinophagales bacterium]
MVKQLALLILFCCVYQVQAQLIADKVVAVVGDNPILLSDIEMQYVQAKAQTESPLSEHFKCEVFDRLMLEKLFLAQAKLDSITTSPDEVEAELDRRIRYFTSVFGSKEKLEEYYGKTLNELKDDFRTDIENQLVSDKMRGKALGNLKVSPAEVKAYFSGIPKDSIPYFNSEVELSQIVMYPTINETQKEIAKTKLEKIRKDIVDGSDFSLQAILYSEDPGSSSEGGDLGYIERGELVPEFEAVAYRLQEKELSEVVETPFGFHIITVDEKRGERLKMRHILVKPKLTQADYVACKSTMDSIKHQLDVDSMTFKEAVGKFSMDEHSKAVGGLISNSKNGTTYFEKSDIEGNLIFALDKIKVGEYTDVLPFGGMERTGEQKQGYRIVLLKSETKPHKASLDMDYPKIQAAAKNAKTQRELERWVKLYKDKTFIRIEEDYMFCNEAQKWLRKSD